MNLVAWFLKRKARAILDRLLRRCVLGLWRRFEFELFDPKSETFSELKKHLAESPASGPTHHRRHDLCALPVLCGGGRAPPTSVPPAHSPAFLTNASAKCRAVLVDVKDAMGHKSIASTTKYAQVTDKRRQQHYERMRSSREIATT